MNTNNKSSEARRQVTQCLIDIRNNFDILQEFKTSMRESCVNCKYWAHEPEICTLFNARPPANIIAFSCMKYEDENDIPF